MKISLDEVKPSLHRGAVVHVAGQTFRKGDRLPKDWPEGTEHAVILRDDRGRLTRAGMEQALREGGSVMIGEVIVERVEDLPDEADLVKHDEVQRARVAASLDDQIAELQRQKAKLSDPGAEGPRTVVGQPDTVVATQPVMHEGRVRQAPARPDVKHAEAFGDKEKPAAREGGSAPPPPSSQPGQGGSVPPPAPAFPPPEESRPRRGRRGGSGEEE
jgi:hypothetical protein